MTKRKKIIIPALALTAALGVGAYGINKTDAYGGFGQASLIEKIAQRFNLNQDEVQKVFDEERQEHRAQSQTNFEQRLSDAVSKGELTEEQRELILDKRTKLEKQREQNWQAHKDLSFEERKAEREKRQAEMKTMRDELKK